MKNSHTIYLKIVIILIATFFSGCSIVSSNDSGSEETNQNQNEGQSLEEDMSIDILKKTQKNLITSNVTGYLSEKGLSFETEDYYLDYDKTKVNYIQLNESSIVFSGEGAFVSDNKISISKPGTYVVFGMLKDGQIMVEETSGGTVRLILKDATIHCENGSPIYIKEAGKVMISLVPGTRNVLTDGSSENVSNLSNQNATIYSAVDLTFNGAGSLVMNTTYQNAISTKGVLKIVEGGYEIHSVGDGIIGKEAVLIDDIKMKIISGRDGIRTDNDSENAKGLVFINDGEFEITTKQDGIKADKNLVLQDGDYQIIAKDDALASDGSISIENGSYTISSGDEGIYADTSLLIAMAKIGITSYEGMESSKIIVKSGQINIVSSDGGINGSTTMTGGTLIIEGPLINENEANDYDGVFEISGGTLLAIGSSNMTMALSSTSKQKSMILNLEEAVEEGTLLCLLEGEDRTPIMAYLPSKSYQWILYSSPILMEGKSYTLSTGGTTTPKEAMNIYTPKAYEDGIDKANVTLNGILTTYGEVDFSEKQTLEKIIE